MRYNIKNQSVLDDILNLKSNDIAPRPKRRKRAMYYVFNFIRFAVFVICLGVFTYSVKNIAKNFASYQESSDMYEDIKNNFASIGQNTVGSLINSPNPIPLKEFDKILAGDGEVEQPQSNEDFTKIVALRAALDSMKGEIPDIYGWIKVPGTNIDYPLVQGKDNKYYVNYDAKKNSNYAGAIFVDFRHKKTPDETRNMMIYGHNVRTWGTMFNGLVNFLYEDFFRLKDSIELYTYDGIYTYTVISVCETDIYSNYSDIYFSTDEEFESFCNDVLNRSLYKREGVTIDKDSKLVTLSTCSNSFNGDKRYAVVGVLTEKLTYKQQ